MIDPDEDEIPDGPRIPVTELRPFAPATGAFLTGHVHHDGRPIQVSFDPGDSDAIWSETAISDWFEGLERLPRNTPLRMVGRLTRGRDMTERARLRALRVSDPAGNILWHAIPAGEIVLGATYLPAPLAPLTNKKGKVLFEYPPARPTLFRATSLTHDPDLLAAIEAIPSDAQITVFSQPDNYLRSNDWYGCPHCVRKSALDPHQAGCPMGAEHRFLLGLFHDGQFLITERRGAGTAYRLYEFGPARGGVGDWFELAHKVWRHELHLTRFDPADPGAYFAHEGWGRQVTILDTLPDEFLVPVPKSLVQGLGLLAPDPLDLAPVELTISLEDGALRAWGEGHQGPPNLWLWPHGRDDQGADFAHSLTIFELDGGRAALPAAQAAVAAGRVWIEGDRADERPRPRPVFAGVSLYEGEHQIGYAYE